MLPHLHIFKLSFPMEMLRFHTFNLRNQGLNKMADILQTI